MPNELKPEFMAYLKKTAEAAEKEHPSPWMESRYKGEVLNSREHTVAEELDETVVKFVVAADPATVLALIEHIEELEGPDDAE